MILTVKVKHGLDLSDQLDKGRQVAVFAVKTGCRSSKDVTHFGLKSMIANQVLRKYGRSKKIKAVSNVVLPVPSQGCKYDALDKTVRVPCLDCTLDASHFPSFQKIHQIEFNNTYAFVSLEVREQSPMVVTGWMGIDLNATGHCVVAGIPNTGKVLKLGKKAGHTHKKYKSIRRRLQKQGKLKALKRIKNRENRVVRDLNHKISNKLVREAKQNRVGIVLENLKGIRNTKKQAKSFRYALNSWSFAQLGSFIEYKAKLHGVSIVRIAPQYTSQQCSRCGLLGNRNGKTFKCPSCGHVEHADANASFVLALRQQGVLQSIVDRDAVERQTDLPQEATA
jgi:putative transposase